MRKSLAAVAIVVPEYDAAIEFYTRVLRFELLEDTPLGGEKRWVRVSPPGSSGTALLLARAVGPEQESRIGNQTGGRVFLFLHTDDFWRDYRELQRHGVELLTEPREEPYGTVVVFRDPFGNKWDLIEPTGRTA